LWHEFADSIFTLLHTEQPLASLFSPKKSSASRYQPVQSRSKHAANPNPAEGSANLVSIFALGHGRSVKERPRVTTVDHQHKSINALTAWDPERSLHNIRLFFRPSLAGSSLPDFHPSSRVVVTPGKNVLGVS
jgi:hypothetical protein